MIGDDARDLAVGRLGMTLGKTSWKREDDAQMRKGAAKGLLEWDNSDI